MSEPGVALTKRSDGDAHAFALACGACRRSGSPAGPGADLGARRPLGLRLSSCRAGNVAVEFALAAPVLILLMLASAELARFVILHQKMDRVATTISDLVSRAETISESELAGHLHRRRRGRHPVPISPISAW